MMLKHTLKRPLDETDQDGYNHLYYAMMYGASKKTIGKFIDRGYNLNTSLLSAVRCTVMMAVSEDEEVERRILPDTFKVFIDVINLLLDRGADVSTKDRKGESVLFNAVRRPPLRSDIPTFELDNHELVERARKESAQTLNANLIDVITLLLDRGADINEKDGEGNSVLMAAIGSSDDVFVVKLLLEQGADINVLQDINKSSALHVACLRRYVSVEIVELLLDGGLDPNARTSCSELWYTRLSTPLEMICSNSRFYVRMPENVRIPAPQLEVVQLLLAKGSDFHRGMCERKSRVYKIMDRWPTIMAIILLQELTIYFHLDSSSIVDLWQYMHG